MERDLAIVPKRSGVLHFGPATHTLTIIDEKSQRQDRTVVAPPLTLSVGAYPAERGWKWVAEEVTLTDELSTDPVAPRRRRDRHPPRDPARQGHAARGAAAAADRLGALADHLRRAGRAPADPDRGGAGLRGGLGLAVPPRDRRARRAPAGHASPTSTPPPAGWTPSRSPPCPSATRASTPARCRPAASTPAPASPRPRRSSPASLAGGGAGPRPPGPRRHPRRLDRASAAAGRRSAAGGSAARPAAGDLLALRRLLAEARPEATRGRGASSTRRSTGRAGGFDRAGFWRAFRRDVG